MLPVGIYLYTYRYSDDHVERLVRWASTGVQGRKPFLALMPDFFAQRPWFIELAAEVRTYLHIPLVCM